MLAPPNLEIRETRRRGYVSQVLQLEEDGFDALVDRTKRLMASGDLREVAETMLFGLYAAIPPDWRIRDEAEAK